MSKFKKILTLVLSLAMVLSALPAFAAPSGSGKIKVDVYDDKTNDPVAGVKILVEDITAGTPVSLGEIVTDGSGKAEYAAANSGYFRLSLSNATDKYAEDIGPKTVFVDVTNPAGAEVNEYFRLMEKGKLSVSVVNSKDGSPIAGAMLTVKDSLGNLQGNLTTEADGKALLEKLDASEYEVVLESVPVPFVFANGVKNTFVYTGGTSEVKFECADKPFITVDTKIEGGNVPVSGVTFVLKDGSGAVVATKTGSGVGDPRFDELVPDVYTVEVQSAPEGYSPVNAAVTLDLRSGMPKQAQFSFNKFSAIMIKCVDKDDMPLEGTLFQVRDADGKAVGLYKTDIEGTIYTDTLKPGKYLVQEMIASDGFIPDSYTRTVTVRSNELSKELFTNNAKSCIIVYSYDSYGNVVPNTSYKIKNTQTGVQIEEIAADENGIGISNQLAPGLYMVEEVNIPEGYVLEKPAYNYVYVGLNQASALRFIHTPKSVIKIQTVDKAGNVVPFAKYQVTSVKEDFTANFQADANGEAITDVLKPGIYEVKQTVAPEGYMLNTTTQTITIVSDKVEFAKFINEKIAGVHVTNIDTNGNPVSGSVFKITTIDGTVIGKYTANKYGQFDVTLQPGAYKLIQTVAPNGYMPSSEVIDFTVQTDKALNLEFINKLETGIRVKVVDRESGDPIYGVSINIFDTSKKLVGNYKTDNHGMIYLDGAMQPGRYTLEMVSVPSGYTLDKENKTFVVVEGQVSSMTWKISGIKGQIRILTYAGEDSALVNIRKNTLLRGVSYEIIDSTGKVVSTISDKDGYAYSGALPLGTYYISQVRAARGFAVNSQRVTVNITEANKDVNITVYDPAADYTSSLDMKGPASLMAGKSGKFYVAAIEGPKTAAKNFYMNFKIPTDCLRMGTFYTGTYNQYATYRIEYKTNTSGAYRILAQNLSSFSNYSYDLSSPSLNLSAGEYVTDVRIVFPNVEKGFKSSVAPSFFAYALATVRNGWQYNVRAEIGSLADGNNYYTNASEFRGIIYNNGSANINGTYYNYYYTGNGTLQYILLPGQLLKTGY